MSISDEFHFIDSIRPNKFHQESLLIGIGDDAALYASQPDMDEVVCMDSMVENVHFTKDTMAPFDIGYKALASNISDVAAMGGMPLFFLVSIAIPKHWEESALREIYEGLNALGQSQGMDLIGGDTVSSNHDLIVTVTVVGRIEKGKRLLRSNARVGDVVFVSGTLGDSAAGLHILQEKRKESYSEVEQFLIKRHRQPDPRVDVGRFLTSFERVALNDISDGIASEANEISQASGVGIVLLEDKLPMSQGLKMFEPSLGKQWVLNGGEDYELTGTMSREEWEGIDGHMRNQLGLTEIGTVIDGEGEVFLKQENEQHLLQKAGYNHFKDGR